MVFASPCRCETDLQRQKQETQQLTNRLTAAEKESQELRTRLSASQKEAQDLTQEHHALLEWRKAKEALIHGAEAAQQELTDRMTVLDNRVATLNEANDELQVQTQKAATPSTSLN